MRVHMQCDIIPVGKLMCALSHSVTKELHGVGVRSEARGVGFVRLDAAAMDGHHDPFACFPVPVQVGVPVVQLDRFVAALSSSSAEEDRPVELVLPYWVAGAVLSGHSVVFT